MKQIRRAFHRHVFSATAPLEYLAAMTYLRGAVVFLGSDMQTHRDKLGVNSIDDREQGELVRCPRCHNWLECYELGDYFCRKCRPIKQEMSRVDTFFKQLADEVFKEINK